jgi:hypothetical protein
MRRLRGVVATFVPFVDADAPTRMEDALGGVKGRLTDAKIKLLQKVSRAVWKGKVFYRDQRILRNFTENTIVDAIIKADDREAVEKTEIPRVGLLSYFSPMTTVNLLFPAKLLCGQSLVDGRRESIIIDYAFNDEVPGYRKNPDGLVGRNGLRVREELRMIRPGFYLGRAYMHRILVVNFTLYNPKEVEAGLDAFTGCADHRGLLGWRATASCRKIEPKPPPFPLRIVAEHWLPIASRFAPPTARRRHPAFVLVVWLAVLAMTVAAVQAESSALLVDQRRRGRTPRRRAARSSRCFSRWCAVSLFFPSRPSEGRSRCPPRGDGAGAARSLATALFSSSQLLCLAAVGGGCHR